MTAREPICRRVDSALVFVSGVPLGGEQLGRFLDDLHARNGGRDAATWSAAELEAAFLSTFGVAVRVWRYAFDPPAAGVAFHIGPRADDWAERAAS